MVGTGDAAIGTNPRNLDSLGGKVLRVDRMTGRPLKGNPYFSGKGNRRLVFTYGHRNVQGLAMRPDGSILSVEHGSDRDDEVNIIRAGRDFGWNPVPGYNESVPMTDQRLPGRQFEAVWRSGSPTIAPSGADIVRGAAWGSLRGTLAVGVLKGKRVMFLTIGSTGGLRAVTVPAALTRYGRIRDVTAPHAARCSSPPTTATGATSCCGCVPPPDRPRRSAARARTEAVGTGTVQASLPGSPAGSGAPGVPGSRQHPSRARGPAPGPSTRRGRAVRSGRSALGHRAGVGIRRVGRSRVRRSTGSVGSRRRGRRIRGVGRIRGAGRVGSQGRRWAPAGWAAPDAARARGRRDRGGGARAPGTGGDQHGAHGLALLGGGHVDVGDGHATGAAARAAADWVR